MLFQVPAGAVRSTALNGWYPGANALEISVRTPGRFITPFQPLILTGEPVRTYTLPDAKISIVTPGPDPANGDIQFWVDIQGITPGAPITSGIWQLRVRNVSGTEAEVNVWTLDDQEAPTVFFTGTSVKDSMKIGAPGAAAGAITVASYTTRVEWTDIDGNVRQVGLALDDISDFSSEGPIRKGAQQKPEVAAPGAMIIACLSSKSGPQRAEMVNMEFRVMAGTSMATPFVVGLVALLLERDPGLDPNGVRAKLRSNSAIPVMVSLALIRDQLPDRRQ
jgi:subtilisin family serine protease